MRDDRKESVLMRYVFAKMGELEKGKARTGHDLEPGSFDWKQEWRVHDEFFEYIVSPPIAEPEESESADPFEPDPQTTSWLAEIRDSTSSSLVCYEFCPGRESAVQALESFCQRIGEKLSDEMTEFADDPAREPESGTDVIAVLDPGGGLVYEGTADYYAEVFGLSPDEEYPDYDPDTDICHGVDKTEGFTMRCVRFLGQKMEENLHARDHSNSISPACLRARHTAGLPDYDWRDSRTDSKDLYPRSLDDWKWVPKPYIGLPHYEYWTDPPSRQCCRIMKSGGGWYWDWGKFGGGSGHEGPLETPEAALEDFLYGRGKCLY